MARYALPPNWEDFKDHDLALGDTLLKALAEARVFSVSKVGDNYCIEEMCDEYFNAVLTPNQLYCLGVELQVLASSYLDDLL